MIRRFFLLIFFIVLVISCSRNNSSEIIRSSNLYISNISFPKWAKVNHEVQFIVTFNRIIKKEKGIKVLFSPTGVTNEVYNFQLTQDTSIFTIKYSYSKSGRFLGFFAIKEKDVLDKQEFLIRVEKDHVPVIDYFYVDSNTGFAPLKVIFSISAHDPDVGNDPGDGISRVEYFFSNSVTPDIVQDESFYPVVVTFASPGIFKPFIRVYGDEKNCYTESHLRNPIIVSAPSSYASLISATVVPFFNFVNQVYPFHNKIFFSDNTNKLNIVSGNLYYLIPTTVSVWGIYPIDNEYSLLLGDRGAYIEDIVTGKMVKCNDSGLLPGNYLFARKISTSTFVLAGNYGGNPGFGILYFPSGISTCNKVFRWIPTGIIPDAFASANNLLFTTSEWGDLNIFSIKELISGYLSPITTISQFNDVPAGSQALDVLDRKKIYETMQLQNFTYYYDHTTKEICGTILDSYPDPTTGFVVINSEGDIVTQTVIDAPEKLLLLDDDNFDPSSGCSNYWISVTYYTGYKLLLSYENWGPVVVNLWHDFSGFVVQSEVELSTCCELLPSVASNLNILKWINESEFVGGFGRYGVSLFKQTNHNTNLLGECDVYNAIADDSCKSSDDYLWNRVYDISVTNDSIFSAEGEAGIYSYSVTGENIALNWKKSFPLGGKVEFYSVDITNNNVIIGTHEGPIYAFPVTPNNRMLKIAYFNPKETIECGLSESSHFKIEGLDYDNRGHVFASFQYGGGKGAITFLNLNGTFHLQNFVCGISSPGPGIIYKGSVYFFSDKILYKWNPTAPSYNNMPVGYLDFSPQKVKVKYGLMVAISDQCVGVLDLNRTYPLSDILYDNESFKKCRLENPRAELFNNQLILSDNGGHYIESLLLPSEKLAWKIKLDSFGIEETINDVAVKGKTLVAGLSDGFLVIEIGSGSPVFNGYYRGLSVKDLSFLKSYLWIYDGENFIIY